MRQLLIVTLLAAAVFFGPSPASAQDAADRPEVPNKGVAPKQPDGIGRLDLRVVDESGNPVEGVRADLKSKRTNGQLCESWNWTDAGGVAVLPPLHMGQLQLVLKAKGYETAKLTVNAADLGQPLRVTLVRKN